MDVCSGTKHLTCWRPDKSTGRQIPDKLINVAKTTDRQTERTNLMRINLMSFGV